jgi:hypothetical protein
MESSPNIFEPDINVENLMENTEFHKFQQGDSKSLGSGEPSYDPLVKSNHLNCNSLQPVTLKGSGPLQGAQNDTKVSKKHIPLYFENHLIEIE